MEGRQLGNAGKTLFVWLMIFMVLFAFIWFIKQPGKKVKEIEYSEFIVAVEDLEVESVTIKGEKITGEFEGGEKFSTIGPKDEGQKLYTLLKANNVETVKFEKDEETPLFQLIFTYLPILLIVFFMIFFIRQMQNTGGKAMSFGKSRARLLNEGQQKATFEDVAGIDEAKEELEEIIDFLKDPRKFTKLGGRIPKGVLLVGAPGTGKTLLARAIAGEAGVPFLSISGSDFVEMFVGVGASRVRDLFVQGKKHAPCIIFIDELDAVGRHRGAGLGGGHDEREQTLNQLLVELDGFESNEGVIMMAATNRPDVLDPALLRPGRFDRQVVVPRPDVRGRAGILKVHTRKTPISDDVDMEVLAKGTPGFSGADIENMVNEASLIAARREKDQVDMEDFEFAKDKVLMGAERRSLVISEDERRMTAYHEAGHALMAKLVPGSDPVHKVTIIPRGRALGATQQLPTEDKYTISKSKALNDLVILMGGRVAEETALSEQTSGAGNDIERATELARKMVCDWGMSDRLGPLNFGGKEEEIFMGRDFAVKNDFSNKTAELIDDEIKKIVTEAHERAVKLIEENRDKLEALAEALLEHEALDAEQVDMVMRGEEIPALVSRSGPDRDSSKKESLEKKKKPAVSPPLVTKPDPVTGEA
jgi:cell division protease FtsH